MKCIYLLIQIAHIFNQLIEKGSLLTKEIRKALGSIREIAQRLLEELRYFFFSPGEFKRLITQRIQIRFDTSWFQLSAPVVSPQSKLLCLIIHNRIGEVYPQDKKF